MLELSTKDSETLNEDDLKSLIKSMDNREILIQDVINDSLIAVLIDILNKEYTVNEAIAALRLRHKHTKNELANRQLNSLIKQQKPH